MHNSNTITLELAESSKVRAQLCASYPKESQVLQIKITSSVAIGLTIPIVVARLVARFTISGRLFGDDLVIVLASVSNIPLFDYLSTIFATLTTRKQMNKRL